VVLEADQADEDLTLSLTPGELFVKRLAIVPVRKQHFFYIWCDRFVTIADWVETFRVPMLHQLFDRAASYFSNGHHLISVPKVGTVLKDRKRLSPAEALVHPGPLV